MKMCELSPTSRPYEKLEQYGASVLSDEELLAIVLRTGMKGKSSLDIANMLLSSPEMSYGLQGIQMMTVAELSQYEGIGRVKAIGLKASLELGRRCMTTNGIEPVRFLTSERAMDYFEEKMAFLESEEVHAVYVDAQKRLILHETICKGSINCVGVCMRELFRTAVRVNAYGMIIAHNHPGGILDISEEDVSATRIAVKNGNLIGIEVIDHIIVADRSSISMKKLGYMEE